MNKIDIRKIIEKKLFEQSEGEDEFKRMRAVKKIVSTYTITDIELILSKKKPLYFNPRTGKEVYLS